MITINKAQNDIVTLTIDNKESPTNIINEKFIDHFETIIEEVTRDLGTKGLIITSTRKEFLSGADLEMILSQNDAVKVYELAMRLHKSLRMLETWEKPVVAALNGSALGGGLELALACHYRVSINHSSIQFGLPEVTLGLLPGGGGTQRLPRILGIEKSLPFLLQGKRLNPLAAREAGIIDDLTETKEEMLQRAQAFIEQNPEIQKPWDKRGFKIPEGDVQSPKGYQIFAATQAMIKKQTFSNYPAPQKILSALYEGLQVNFDRAMEIEAMYFAELVTHRTSKLMVRSLFYGMNEANKCQLPNLPQSNHPIKKVGILGAGMMGAGIAYSCAKAGIPVLLKDINKEASEKGKAYSGNLLQKKIERGFLTKEQKEIFLSQIETTSEVSDLKDCDLIIEAVTEDRNLKATVTKETEAVVSTKTIFGSNTSTLPITSLAYESQRPEQFIGLHFFSPVDKMPLLEIIKGEKTSKETLATCLNFCKMIKKTPIVVNDGRGFYTSRVFTTYVTEGITCLSEGISPALIENAGKAAGMPVGPLAIADEVSIDLIYHILKATAKDIGIENIDQKTYKITDRFVNELDRLGKKVSKGFYEYPLEGKKFLSPILKDEFSESEQQPPLNELKRRLLTIQTIEAIKCIEEKVLCSARDGDIGSILGWGFPAYTGGVLSYVDYRGAKKFLTDCLRFEEKLGKRFSPPKLLRDLVSRNLESFYEAKDFFSDS